MNNKVVSSIIAAAAATVAATAGEVAAPQSAAESHTCNALKTLGKVYKNSSNPFIQEVKLFGRGQFQYGYVDADHDVAGADDSEGFAEWRRVRMGAQVKFAKFFDAKVRADLEDGGANNHDFTFGGYDEAKFGFNAGKAFGIDFFDKVYITYGRDKIEFGEDQHTSSKKIKTVERTALTNTLRPGNATGAALNLAKGDWKGAIGVFNNNADGSDDGRKLFNDFGDDQFIYATSTFGLEGGDLILDFIADSDQDEYSTSVSYRTEVADWDLALNAVYADRDGDNLYGVVIQPSKFIVEDKLEVVGRYYFQGSNADDGVSTNSRNIRNLVGRGNNAGDAHHSIYAGLNYYLCGHNAKIMTGVEYEDLSGENDITATTLWSAVRFYF